MLPRRTVGLTVWCRSGLKTSPALAQQVQYPVGQGRFQQPSQHPPLDAAKVRGDRTDHLRGRRGDVHGQAFVRPGLQQPAQLIHGARADGHGAVPALAAHGGFQPAGLFFGDLDRIKALFADVQAEAAKLPQGVAHTGKQAGVLLHQEARQNPLRLPRR